MNLMLSIEGKRAYISIAEEANHADFTAVYPMLEKAEIDELCLDLKDLYYIMSAQIAEILGLKKWAGAKNIPVVLLNPNPNVYQILDMSYLLGMFIIRQDYSRYSVNQLISMLASPENASDVADYFASHYTDEISAILKENIKSTETDDPVIQENSLIAIGKAQDDSALESIRGCLESAYPDVVRAALLVLGWLGDVSSKEQIYGFITSANTEVAEAAGASIALLSDEEDAEKLGGVAKEGSNSLKIIVAGTLSLINGEEAFRVLLSMLKNETDEKVRKVLTRSISFFNKPEATEILIKLLDDSSKAVQEAAAAGLERTGLRGHDELVLKKAAGGGWVGYFAVKALSKHCRPENVEFFINSYEEMDASIKLAVVEALGYADCSPKAEKFLMVLLGDENEDIRKEALSSMAKLCRDRVVEASEKMVLNDPSWLVRYRALEILENIRPEGFVKILTEVKGKDKNRYIQEKLLSIGYLNA